MRISFAWPKAAPTAPASASAIPHFKLCMVLPCFDWFDCEWRILFRARLRLGTAADGDGGVDLLVLAAQLHLRLAAGGERGDEVQHRGGISHRPALDLEEHVAGLDARLVGRAA